MKKLSMIFALLAMLVFTGTTSAQERNKYNSNYPEDFTKEQADSTISARNSEIKSLENDLNTTKAAIDKANADLQQRMADNDKCKNDLYALVGTDRNGFFAYRERLARAESELGSLRSLSAEQL